MSKPIKPRRMWQTEHDQRTSICLNCANENAGYTRPVLVIDLSPESVEALVAPVARKLWSCAEDRKEGRHTVRAVLAAIGIKARGRK